MVHRTEQARVGNENQPNIGKSEKRVSINNKINRQ